MAETMSTSLRSESLSEHAWISIWNHKLSPRQSHGDAHLRRVVERLQTPLTQSQDERYHSHWTSFARTIVPGVMAAWTRSISQLGQPKQRHSSHRSRCSRRVSQRELISKYRTPVRDIKRPHSQGRGRAPRRAVSTQVGMNNEWRVSHSHQQAPRRIPRTLRSHERQDELWVVEVVVVTAVLQSWPKAPMPSLPSFRIPSTNARREACPSCTSTRTGVYRYTFHRSHLSPCE
jgi:hypothetical protein